MRAAFSKRLLDLGPRLFADVGAGLEPRQRGVADPRQLGELTARQVQAYSGHAALRRVHVIANTSHEALTQSD